MKNLPITVEALRPVAGVKTIVCNNSDYMVVWDLDEDWDQAAKTMRCTWPDGTYQDVVFTGTEAALPLCPAPGKADRTVCREYPHHPPGGAGGVPLHSLGRRHPGGTGGRCICPAFGSAGGGQGKGRKR